MREKRLLTIIVATCSTLAVLASSTSLASAQIGNFGYGSSTAGGSGGAPTGPSNLSGIYGVSSSGGSGGAPTSLTNPGTFGYGLSAHGGSGGTATGPTNPILPQFGGTSTPGSITAPAMIGSTPGVVSVTPGVVNTTPGLLSSTPGIGATSGIGSMFGLAPDVTGVATTTVPSAVGGSSP